MYSAQMAVSIRKMYLVLFGKQIDVLRTERVTDIKNVSPCAFVLTNDVSQISDPDVCKVIEAFPDKKDYIIIFDSSLTSQINTSLVGRPHIKAGMIVWSICIKVIWEKVRFLYRCQNPEGILQEDILTSEQLVSCLPKGFELPYEFDHMDPQEFIEILYEQELDGYKVDLAMPQEVIEAGVLHSLAEMSVISHIALRCGGEAKLINFVKACCDLVLNKA